MVSCFGVRDMVCEHLRPVERELAAAGIKETFRGQAWSDRCREFVYFDCILDLESIRRRIPLPCCVKDEEYSGTHMGSERGFYCVQCEDGIMGRYPKQNNECRVFG